MIERRVRAATRADRKVLRRHQSVRDTAAISLGCAGIVTLFIASAGAVWAVLMSGTVTAVEAEQRRWAGITVAVGGFFVLASAMFVLWRRDARSLASGVRSVEELVAQGIASIRVDRGTAYKGDIAGPAVVLVVDSSRAVCIFDAPPRGSDRALGSRVVLLRGEGLEYWRRVSLDGPENRGEELSDRRTLDWIHACADPVVAIAEMPGRLREACERALGGAPTGMDGCQREGIQSVSATARGSMERRSRPAVPSDRELLRRWSFIEELIGSVGMAIWPSAAAAGILAIGVLLIGGAVTVAEAEARRWWGLAVVGAVFLVSALGFFSKARASTARGADGVEEITVRCVAGIRVSPENSTRNRVSCREAVVLVVDQDRAVVMSHHAIRGNAECRGECAVLLRCKGDLLWGLSTLDGPAVIEENVTDSRALAWLDAMSDPEVRVSDMPGKLRDVCEGVLRRAAAVGIEEP